MRKLPPTEYLHECFLYDEESGKLFWKARPPQHFPNPASAGPWNKRWAGKEAFYGAPGRHRFGNLDNKYCAAHRVIWKMKTGNEPPPLIDHKDRNKGNNRWSNLRDATKSQNSINRDPALVGASGLRGVHKHKNKWVAQAGSRSGKRYLGIFDSPEEAYSARRAAEKRLYGEFTPR